MPNVRRLGRRLGNQIGVVRRRMGDNRPATRGDYVGDRYDMNDHAKSLRAIAQMLEDETGVDTKVTAIKALEVVIDKLGGTARPYPWSKTLPWQAHTRGPAHTRWIGI